MAVGAWQHAHGIPMGDFAHVQQVPLRVCARVRVTGHECGTSGVCFGEKPPSY